MPPFSEQSDTATKQSIILVVDDDPSILMTIQEILKSEGYHVIVAANGAEGLERVRQLRPALVLLDMRMPIMDGWGFARQLKAQGVQIPILVMTAAQNASHWAEEIGAQGYIDKPFDVLQLLDTVAGMLA